MILACGFVVCLVLRVVLTTRYARTQQIQAMRQRFDDPGLQRSIRVQDFESRLQFERSSNEVVERELGRLPQDLLERFHTSDTIVAQQFPGLFIDGVIDHDHDHDRCCPTRVLHEKPLQLRNTLGQTRVLAHFPRIHKFQFVRRAECVPSIGNCDGRCVIEDITAYFVVWNITGGRIPFTVDSFQIPGYCSCKSR